MAEIRFYHLERQSLDQVLPMLLNKALQNGHRIIVKAPDTKEVERINTHLWTYDPNSFLPHGSNKDEKNTDQPVWITDTDENLNNADVLILTQGRNDENLEGFNLVCDMIDGRNEDTVAQARKRWQSYKDAKHHVTYWQQTPEGKWHQKS